MIQGRLVILLQIEVEDGTVFKSKRQPPWSIDPHRPGISSFSPELVEPQTPKSPCNIVDVLRRIEHVESTFGSLDKRTLNSSSTARFAEFPESVMLN